jgi:hypothetical protein
LFESSNCFARCFELCLFFCDLTTFLLFGALQFAKSREPRLIFRLESAQLRLQLCRRSLLLFSPCLHFECLLFFHFDLPPLPRESPFNLRGSILQFRHLGFLKLQHSGLLINLLLPQRDLCAQIFQTFRLLLDLPLRSSFVLLNLRLNLHQFL